MAYTPVPTYVTGDPFSAADANTYWRDNFAAGVPGLFTAAGSIAVASGSEAAAELAVGSLGQYLSAGATAPVWGGLIGAFGYDAATGYVSNNNSTDITFDSEKYDTHGFIDLGTYPKRITIPANLDGIYLITGWCWVAPASGVTLRESLYIRRYNSSNVLQSAWTGQVVDAGTTMAKSISVIAVDTFAVGDYLTAVYENYSGDQASMNQIYIGLILLGKS